MATPVQAVSPSAAAEHTQSLFRIGGSDTTYELMTRLDTIYNGSVGCKTVDTRIASANTGPQHLHDNTCQMEDVDEDLDQNGSFDPDANPLQQSRRANYDHDVIMQYYPLGSSFGVRQLQRQDPATAATACGRSAATVPPAPAAPPVNAACPTLDAARSSRAISANETTSGLRMIGYAREGLSWVCFRKLATAGCSGGSLGTSLNLSQATIQKIVACDPTADQWNEVGGALTDTRRIDVYQAQAGSGTRSSWDGFTGITTTNRTIGVDGTPAACAAPIFENNGNAIDAAERETAFYYYSTGRFFKNPANMKIGRIDNIPPDLLRIATAEFPYTRIVNNAIRWNDPDGMNANIELREYLSETGFLCKPSAQHTTNPNTGHNYRFDIELGIRLEGFAPIPPADSGGPASGTTSHCRVTGAAGAPGPAFAPALP